MFASISSVDDVGPLTALAETFFFPEWDELAGGTSHQQGPKGEPAPPPPLPLFIRTKDQSVLLKNPKTELWNIFPRLKTASDGTMKWRYDLGGCVVQQSSREGSRDMKMHIHAGMDRSLILHAHDTDVYKNGSPVVKFVRRYAHPSMLVPSDFSDRIRDPDAAEEILGRGRYSRPANKVCSFHLSLKSVPRN